MNYFTIQKTIKKNTPKIAFTFLIIATWILAIYLIRSNIQNSITKPVKHLINVMNDNGYSMDYSKIRISGYPFRINVIIDDVKIHKKDIDNDLNTLSLNDIQIKNIKLGCGIIGCVINRIRFEIHDDVIVNLSTKYSDNVPLIVKYKSKPHGIFYLNDKDLKFSYIDNGYKVISMNNFKEVDFDKTRLFLQSTYNIGEDSNDSKFHIKFYTYSENFSDLDYIIKNPDSIFYDLGMLKLDLDFMFESHSIAGVVRNANVKMNNFDLKTTMFSLDGDLKYKLGGKDIMPQISGNINIKNPIKMLDFAGTMMINTHDNIEYARFLKIFSEKIINKAIPYISKQYSPNKLSLKISTQDKRFMLNDIDINEITNVMLS
jgi:hypothetical protein